MLFRARQFKFTFPRPALVMGIVNVTPDSFSDGGKYFRTEAAVEHGLQLVEQGAEILDIGGESTRPNAEPVSEPEELRRVIPVIEQLAAKIKSRWGEAAEEPARGDAHPTKQVLISIDTMKPAVARAALQAGASIVNDVAANRKDEEMWRVVAEAGAGYVAMHMQGTPGTMQLNPTYSDVVREVEDFFDERLQCLNACGVSTDQVALDVGIGFGKTLEHNLALLGALNRFTRLARPLMIGVSRKSFIKKLLGTDTAALPASLACASLAVENGANIIRAHDVVETVNAIRMTEAILTARTK